MSRASLTRQVLDAILAERDRQDEKWGRQRPPHDQWMTMLVEEVGESAAEIEKYRYTGSSKLLEEVTQVAAVAAAWMEQLLEEKAKE